MPPTLFAFDPAGNIGIGQDEEAVTKRQIPKVLDNLLKEYAGTSYGYDERGNLIERVQAGRRSRFEWDAFNRMAKATTAEGTTTFAYDPLGRRIAKRSERVSPGGVRREETVFGWDGDTIAFESRRSHDNGAAQTVHYIHEPGGFVPLVQAKRSEAIRLWPSTDVKALMAANGGKYDSDLDPVWNGELDDEEVQPFGKEEIVFYQCDHLGTPQELTDHEGNVAWAAQYKAWGQAKEAISEAARRAGITNPIRFQGQYFDDETGLNYNRYRYYDPHSGRFVSRDPIGLLGGLNLHQYAPNALEWIDPLGLAGNRANRRAGQVLQDQQAASGGHAYSRHGAHATMPQQEHRARTGVPPDQPCRTPRSRGPNSTRFFSNVDQLDAIQRGTAEMNRTGRNEATVNMGRTIGEGYRSGGGCPETTTRATVVRGPNGIVTAYPDLGPRTP